MPDELPTEALDAAHAAVVFAQQVRKRHARRTSKRDKQREDDIRAAMKKLRAAMKPLKSHIGYFPYGSQTPAAEENRDKIREASKALQRERRKLWKMEKK